MNVEIYGAKFVNKGAELMLLAIKERILKRYPDANFILDCRNREEFKELSSRGFKKKLVFRKNRFLVKDLGKFLPKSSRERYGIVLDNEIDVVFEASGFAYGDQWTPRMAKFIKIFAEGWKRNGTKVIFMPQAFGPFENGQSARHIKRALTYANLVYARDQQSYNYLNDLGIRSDNLRQSPDFTMILPGTRDPKYDWCKGRPCLIPNNKVISTSNDSEIKENYINFFRTIISYFKEKGHLPFVLIHEGVQDYKLAKEIQGLDNSLKIVWEKDPLIIKGIIGDSKGVIGSRFHGLVSALSQGVPSIAIGWSHKYDMLFSDFGIHSNVLSLNMSKTDIIEALETTFSNDKYQDVKNSIIQKAALQKARIEKMWEEIYEQIDGRLNDRFPR